MSGMIFYCTICHKLNWLSCIGKVTNSVLNLRTLGHKRPFAPICHGKLEQILVYIRKLFLGFLRCIAFAIHFFQRIAAFVEFL